MNKVDLVNKVAESANLKKKDAEVAVNSVFSAIEEALAAGDKVQIIGFGTFETRERSARSGRNPQTGETISIPASVVPAFKPGNRLKDVIK
ncbi:HU family DNA-binding protein [Alicyclobacillus tolerans]|uniref:HU family DNA-binding protein n=1 Tax=Alicyclobacillus tolerans TaxID=90970 RepID=UPI001F1C99DB|nr:HU family DNA-binding protein [Alicyclobacillus tolerans]MCF8566308.1 HU family DNA-binding protein [Alicyclobacillus tolerans]